MITNAPRIRVRNESGKVTRVLIEVAGFAAQLVHQGYLALAPERPGEEGPLIPFYDVPHNRENAALPEAVRWAIRTDYESPEHGSALLWIETPKGNEWERLGDAFARYKADGRGPRIFFEENH